MTQINVTIAVVRGEATTERADPYYTSNTGLPPNYQGIDYEVNVSFDVVDPNDTNNYIVLSVTPATSEYFDFTTSPDSVTVESNGNDPFDQFYTFIYQENEEYETRIQEVDDARTEGFDALVSWTPPPQQVINVPLSFEIEYANSTTPTVSLFQTYATSHNRYFEYPPYTQEVRDFVSEGNF